MLGQALLDLARLLIRVHVERQPLGDSRSGRSPRASLRDTHARSGGRRRRDSAAAQILDLAQVLRDRLLPKTRQASAPICGEQQDDPDPRLLGSFRCGDRFVEPEVVELTDCRVARGTQLAVHLDVLSPDKLRRLPLRLGEHEVAPRPEVRSAAAPAQGALEAVAVGIHETRQAESVGHGRILSTLMATRAVPAPLQQLPNALTIARLALIPVFVVLMLTAEGGHSWPAGIVFGVAGVTDQIDGFLARRWHVESDFGRVFDPLADRLMIDAAVILLFVQDHMPLAGVVVIADVTCCCSPGTRRSPRPGTR